MTVWTAMQLNMSTAKAVIKQAEGEGESPLAPTGVYRVKVPVLMMARAETPKKTT